MKKPFQLISGMTAIIAVILTAVYVVGQPEVMQWLREIDLNDTTQVLVLLGIFVVPIAALLISYFEYHGFGCQDGIIRRGDHEAKMVAITFDDGPNPIFTPKILDVLKEKEVKATFFVVGLHVKKYPDIAKRIVDEGHDIGNHTYTHKDMVPSTRRMVLAQTKKTDLAIRRITGVKTNLFRPPRGIYSNAVRKVLVEELGYRLVLWSVSSIDWRRMMSPQTILRRIARYTKPGAILLFHDSGSLFRREGASRENTVESLPLVIDHLHAHGYKIVTISEMLERLDEQEIDEAAGVLREA